MSKIETFFNIIKNAQKASSLYADEKARVYDQMGPTPTRLFLDNLNNQFHYSFLEELLGERISFNLIEDTCGEHIKHYTRCLVSSVLFETTKSPCSEWMTVSYSHLLWSNVDRSKGWIDNTERFKTRVIGKMFMALSVIDALVNAASSKELYAIARHHAYEVGVLGDNDLVEVGKDVIRKERETIMCKYPVIPRPEIKETLRTSKYSTHQTDYQFLIELDKLETLLLA